MKINLTVLIALSVAWLSADELPQRYHITNVKIFNGWDDQLVAGDVIVEGNKIIEVSNEPLASIATANVRLIDGRGCILSPGFIDCHTHVALVAAFDKLENEYDAVYVGAVGAQMAENMLMRGFTSIRDAGGSSIGMMNAINDDYIAGPRIYSSGAFLTQTSGHLDMHDNTARHRMIGGQPSYAELVGHYITADGEAEVTAAVRENMRKGATQIKIATNGGISSRYAPLDIYGFTQAEIQAIVTAADEFGTYVLAHVYYPDAVKRSLEAGIMSIEHGNMMDEAAMRLLVEKGAFLSIQASASKAQSPAFFTYDQRAKHKLARDGFYELIRLAIKHEAKIVFSSDWFGSKDAYDLQAQEWIAREDLFNGAEIMRQATGRAGELLSLAGERNPFKEGKLGVIEKGAYADLVLIEGNPLEDITILAQPDEHLKLIMKDGVIYKDAL
ncbi:metal-dependent hydrolase family protein [Coraliomargarita akajimensis]|uniref:Amidohydrolase n=1 Tax=Coraliomargarita akajimensis (strain DSM 45221 / IAM 15411 / JCM 23193 / KCTC 12865 / 04OKA010-24) TaxID=583355 RepID=D5EPD0_CORAD|nr:amidohydrolase family protein [Coraliomargarita akajimensis]ADE55640.1 amidohydrolase [Coraliomargarita akajimensis DSM 45221]